MRECTNCEGVSLSWDTFPLTQGQPITIFFLGCDDCSETLISHVHPDQVAVHLNEINWRP